MSHPQRTLTSMESEALSRKGKVLNLTDGHPRHSLTASQRAIVATMPTMFDEVLERPFADVELQAHKSFFQAIGQSQAPVGCGRVLSTYSSTIALDIVARALSERGNEVAVLHPTFDNIADLFRARGLTLRPIAQHEVDDGCMSAFSCVSAVVMVHPNNPTGWVMDRDRLRCLAECCARRGQVLVMDCSFRGQDNRACFDSYEVLNASGVEWVVVEDTGKLWAVSELKSGFLAWSEHSSLRLVEAFDEVMLSVSPVILLLIARLAEDAAYGGFEEMRVLIDTHRRLVAKAVMGHGLDLTDPSSRISVARITLPSNGPEADAIYTRLAARGVHTLPCSRFHWARPQEGARQLRLSLSRPTSTVDRAVRALLEVAP